MGVTTFKDKEGRTRYRVYFSRGGRRLVDERLPPGITRAQADEYDAKIKSDWFNQTRLGIAQVPLISEVIREYERVRVPNQRSRFFKHCIGAIAPHVLGKTLDQLPEVADLVAQSLQNRSPATISKYVAFCRTLGRFAVKRRIVKHDYGLGIEAIPFDNERQFYLSKRELAFILRFASPQLRRACWQLFYTGMRRGELCSATIKEGRYILPKTKNGDPRIVPIPDACKRIAGVPTMKRDSITAGFRAAARKAGYGHIHLHDLRHSAASHLLNAGADLGTVGFILGHRDGQSTRRYAHLATETARHWLNYAASGKQAIGRKGLTAGTEPSTTKKKAA